MSESSQQWRQYSWFSELLRRLFLSSRPTTRDPAERETECEWRDPENGCTTTLMQGVSTGTLSLTPWCAVRWQIARAAWGERIVSAWQRTHLRDFSTTPSVSRSAGSFGLRSK